MQQQCHNSCDMYYIYITCCDMHYTHAIHTHALHITYHMPHKSCIAHLYTLYALHVICITQYMRYTSLAMHVICIIMHAACHVLQTSPDWYLQYSVFVIENDKNTRVREEENKKNKTKTKKVFGAKIGTTDLQVLQSCNQPLSYLIQVTSSVRSVWPTLH